MQAYKKRGFWVGLGVFFLVILSPNPESLSPIGWAVAAVTLLMAIWWATEAVPVAVTALLPLALFPLLQVTDFKAAPCPMPIQIFTYLWVDLYWHWELSLQDYTNALH